MKEFDYPTKTDFIRDAIRTKLNELRNEKIRQEQWEKLLSLKGSMKGKEKKLSKKKWEEIRENAAKKLAEEQFGIKL